jgi:hypothetical protein
MKVKLNGKDYPFEINIRRSEIVNLVRGLDNSGNYKVGLFKVNGVPLKSQVATAAAHCAAYEIYL